MSFSLLQTQTIIQGNPKEDGPYLVRLRLIVNIEPVGILAQTQNLSILHA